MREDIATERDALNRLRIERNLPMRAMAGDMGMTEANLYRILNAPRVVVNDRTAYRVREYLKRTKRNRRVA